MILGEMEFTGYQTADGELGQRRRRRRRTTTASRSSKQRGEPVTAVQASTRPGRKDRATRSCSKADPTIRVDSRAYKMSKSRGNVVNPDAVVDEYGADSLRLYEMFMGPLEAAKPWSMAGVNGVRGFLDRVWRMIVDERAETLELQRRPCRTSRRPPSRTACCTRRSRRVTSDIEQMSFNTAIARMMEFTNFFTKETVRPHAAMEPFVLLLSPFAPHIAEELWQLLGHAKTLAYEPWPDVRRARSPRTTRSKCPCRSTASCAARSPSPPAATRPAIEAAARADARIAELLAGKTVVKVIVVPGRLVNFVMK